MVTLSAERDKALVQIASEYLVMVAGMVHNLSRIAAASAEPAVADKDTLPNLSPQSRLKVLRIVLR